MASIIGIALKGNKNWRCWEDLVEYNVKELENHLKSTMTPEMTWEQYLNADLVIDHILPRELFEYKAAEDPQFLLCWSLKNLRLFDKDKNNKKSDFLENGIRASKMSKQEKLDYLKSKGYDLFYLYPHLNQQDTSEQMPLIHAPSLELFV